MLESSKIDPAVYAALMEEIKRLNADYRRLRKSDTYKIGMLIHTSLDCVRKLRFFDLRRQYSRWINGARSARFPKTARPSAVKRDHPNYFSSERIAVYTAVFGNYDTLLEPYCTPDNIDYYLVTDQSPELSQSAWKRMDISGFEQKLRGLSNAEKNRYFKMHPHELFPNYRYSIYIDGNIQVIADLTEYIYGLDACGLAAHMHSARDCVYEEGDAVVFAKKETRENMDSHLAYLRERQFPEHYGMLECNVLVREHHARCAKLMEEWWQEFMNHCRRDQISLPYVLRCNGIQIEQVGILGDNIFENPSFRLVTHN